MEFFSQMICTDNLSPRTLEEHEVNGISLYCVRRCWMKLQKNSFFIHCLISVSSYDVCCSSQQSTQADYHLFSFFLVVQPNVQTCHVQYSYHPLFPIPTVFTVSQLNTSTPSSTPQMALCTPEELDR